jgi:hypothetical protein
MSIILKTLFSLIFLIINNNFRKVVLGDPKKKKNSFNVVPTTRQLRQALIGGGT